MTTRLPISPNSPIPVIDLADMGEQAADARIITDIADAYGRYGFGYVINHGIDADLRDAVFAASARFHALPHQTKSDIAVNAAHRGYIALNTSTDVTSDLAVVTKPNQSSSFMMMREDPKIDPAVYLSGPNQWPEETPDLAPFKAPVTAFHDAMCQLGFALMSRVVLAAGGNPQDVMPSFATPTSWLRLLHYPPQDSPKASADPSASDEVYGSAPHRDFGALTLLAQDEVGGLQVLTPDGEWVDVPYLPNSFIVNIGDMMHRMSNGRLLSTPHRVINRSGRERYSVPFFYDPHVTTIIAPMPGAGEPQFAPIRFDEFLRHELEASYDAHKQPPASS